MLYGLSVAVFSSAIFGDIGRHCPFNKTAIQISVARSRAGDVTRKRYVEIYDSQVADSIDHIGCRLLLIRASAHRRFAG